MGVCLGVCACFLGGVSGMFLSLLCCPSCNGGLQVVLASVVSVSSLF